MKNTNIFKGRVLKCLFFPESSSSSWSTEHKGGVGEISTTTTTEQLDRRLREQIGMFGGQLKNSLMDKFEQDLSFFRNSLTDSKMKL